MAVRIDNFARRLTKKSTPWTDTLRTLSSWFALASRFSIVATGSGTGGGGGPSGGGSGSPSGASGGGGSGKSGSNRDNSSASERLSRLSDAMAKKSQSDLKKNSQSDFSTKIKTVAQQVPGNKRKAYKRNRDWVGVGLLELAR